MYSIIFTSFDLGSAVVHTIPLGLLKAISTFLIKEETRNTELKMYVENNTKDIPLLKIVFLELKKYRENLNNDYKKIRWLEFFGNKQYTNKPDDVLIQADNLLNLRNWSKEEKLMYDEVTRQQDHYWASLIYAQEEARAKGLAQGIEEGIEQGIEIGRQQGVALGERKGQVMICFKMNLPIEEIQKHTGLSIEEIEAFREELN